MTLSELRRPYLGVRSACMLAPSALASAIAMLSLQETILPEPVHDKGDLAVSLAWSIWKTITPVQVDKNLEEQLNDNLNLR